MKKQLLAGIFGLLVLNAYSSAQAADVVSFTLIDSFTDAPMAGYPDPLPANQVINLNTLAHQTINFRANTNGTVSSVSFNLTGPQTKSGSESVAPYALWGDTNGDYNDHVLVVGNNYSLTGQSSGGTPYTLNFSVTQPAGQNGDGTVTISSNPMQWHAVTLTLDGPFASETGTPNPFLDYRMQVTFTNGTKTYSVPGYFATDGLGPNSTANSGTKWNAHLCPDLTGTWTYTISFTQGANVAVNGGGTTFSPYNGKAGSFTVAATDKTGDDFRGKGRLMGPFNLERYQRFGGASGPVFIKVGADSPETLLAYGDFDNTTTLDAVKGPIKDWAPHVSDWVTGNPTWGGSKGKGLIGALNYLASEKINSISFLTYNLGGDGKNVWPFVNTTTHTQYDVSKLAQWNVIFDHADKLGIHLHFKTQERENDNNTPWALDAGALGNERKLYYRELIARFSHHLALTWNLGEENNQTTAQQQAMAQYFYDNDPYRHLVVIHNYPSEIDTIFTPLLGSASKLAGAAIQIDWTLAHNKVWDWVTKSTNAGKPWVVSNDEQGSANIGVPDDAYTGSPSQTQIRGAVLWGSLLAGGSGIESYFGYDRPQSDLLCQDFRSRNAWWDFCRHAAAFVRTYLPVTEMSNADALVGNSGHTNGKFCFAKAGQVYCVYLPSGGNQSLDLTGQSGTYTVKWYDPRNGGSLLNGATTQVTGGSSVLLGNPPSPTTSDWVALVQSTTAPVEEPWEGLNIGAVGVNGSTDIVGTTFNVWGSGADIFGNADAFQFAHRIAKLSGNGVIKAHITHIDNTNSTAKAGVMLREFLTAGSRHVMMAITPSSTGRFLYRSTADGTTSSTSVASGTAPKWIRLTRNAATFTAAYSADNVNWTDCGTVNISTMPTDLEVGLAVCSHNNSTLCEAIFDTVEITP